MAVASAGPYASLHLAPDRYHTGTSPLSFLQAGCPSCRPTNSVKALKAIPKPLTVFTMPFATVSYRIPNAKCHTFTEGKIGTHIVS